MEVQRVIQVDGMECGRVDGVREEKMKAKRRKKYQFLFNSKKNKTIT